MYTELDFVAFIKSVCDSRKFCNIVEKYRSQIIYETAVNKHVPLIEDNPNETIKYTGIGTY